MTATTERDSGAFRYKLELTGTSAANARELRAAVDAADWTHLQTRTEYRYGVTRLFLACDLPAVELVARELIAHLPEQVRPKVELLGPTTWERVAERLAKERANVLRGKAGTAVIPKGP